MHDNDVLIKNWMDKSDEAVVDTRINISNERFSNAQNRLYYSIFYAVSALAQKNGFGTSKHSQLLGWFNREYIKNNKISKDKAEIYKIAFESRQKSDYTFTFKPNKEILIENLQQAIEFIEVIKTLL